MLTALFWDRSLSPCVGHLLTLKHWAQLLGLVMAMFCVDLTGRVAAWEWVGLLGNVVQCVAGF